MALSILVVSVLVIGILYWIFLAPVKKSTKSVSSLINPDDSYQIGLLCGASGRSIPDAAKMRFALEAFQNQHGRPATTQDIGLVLGLIK